MTIIDPFALASPWHLSDDATRFIMEFPTRPQRLVLRLKADQLDGLLAIFNKARPRMIPPRPAKPPAPGEQVEAIYHAECVVGVQPNGDVAFQVNHPAFGWLCFVFARDRADRIAMAMAEQPTASGAVPEQKAN